MNDVINRNWPIEIKKLRNLPLAGEPFICLFSGGKDCGMALSMAMQSGNAVALIHYIDEDNVSSFHLQKREVIEAQSASLNIPVVYLYDNWWNKWNKLVKIFMEYEKQGVKYVVFGDLTENSNVKHQVTLCQSANIRPCLPLLSLPYEFLIDEIGKRNIKSVISTISHSLIENKWLGKVFDREVYGYFLKLGLDPFGESGEFHTTLVDADCFKYPLNYKITESNGEKIIIKIKKKTNDT